MTLILISLFWGGGVMGGWAGGQEEKGRGKRVQKCKNFIVMDNVLGLVDRSQVFASFLTVTRNIKCRCIYNFHVIYPIKAIWKSIVSQSQMHNIIPAYVDLSSVMGILARYSTRKIFSYIPKNSPWLNRLTWRSKVFIQILALAINYAIVILLKAY